MKQKMFSAIALIALAATVQASPFTVITSSGSQTSYSSFSGACSAASGGCTIRMNEEYTNGYMDCTGNNCLRSWSGTITFDLNGHWFSGNLEAESGLLVIKDSVGGGGIRNSSSTSGIIYRCCGNGVTIEGGYIGADSSGYSLNNDYSSGFIITGGYIENVVPKGGTIEVYGGYFKTDPSSYLGSGATVESCNVTAYGTTWNYRVNSSRSTQNDTTSLISGLVAWYKFDGNANDSSGNGHGLTGSAATWTADRNGSSSSAANFSGSGYLTPSSWFNVQNSMTVSVWVKPNANISLYSQGVGAVSSMSGAIIYPSHGGSAGYAGLGLFVGRNGVIVGEHADSYQPVTLSHAVDLSSGWSLVTVTVTDNGAPMLYVNGVHVKTGNVTTKTNFLGRSLAYNSNQDSSFIGGGRSYYYNGAMDDLRIYNRALSAAEVAALYSGTDTTSARGYVQTGLMGQWDGIENAGYGVHDSSASTWVDLSGHGYNATKWGSSGEWKDNSFVFTRSGTGYFSTPSGFQSTLGSSFTIEAYVKPTAAARNNNAGICGGHRSGSSYVGAGLQSGDNALYGFVHGNYDRTLVNISLVRSSETWPSDEYTHFAFSLDNASGIAKAWRNGVLIDQTTFSAGTVPALNLPDFWIGRAFDEYNRQFDGNIYAVRAYNRALSATEIAQNYALDRQRFSGLIHRWSFNGSLADSVGGATATSLGSYSWTSDGKSISLLGGSYGTSGVDLGANLLPTDGTPVTIEIWAKNRSAKNHARVLDMGSGASYYGPSDAFLMSWSDGTDTTSEYIHAYDGGSRVVTQSGCLAPYTLGTEYHISVVFEPNRDGDSKMAITCVKRNASTGSILRQYSFKSSAAWSLASLLSWTY